VNASAEASASAAVIIRMFHILAPQRPPYAAQGDCDARLTSHRNRRKTLILRKKKQMRLIGVLPLAN
jgi:hypothetical protein